MGVEELKKLMTEIKERSEKDPEVQTSAILQLIEERFANGVKSTKNNR
jgi:hypothetical protein